MPICRSGSSIDGNGTRTIDFGTMMIGAATIGACDGRGAKIASTTENAITAALPSAGNGALTP